MANFYNPYAQNYQYPANYQYAQNNGIVWVQGEAGAKSYLVGSGQSVLLMDSESSTFYIKSTDNSGMPMPLRVFDYKERTQAPAQTPAMQTQYVTHEELRKWTDDLMAKLAREEAQNGSESTL